MRRALTSPVAKGNVSSCYSNSYCDCRHFARKRSKNSSQCGRKPRSKRQTTIQFEVSTCPCDSYSTILSISYSIWRTIKSSRQKRDPLGFTCHRKRLIAQSNFIFSVNKSECINSLIWPPPSRVMESLEA